MKTDALHQEVLELINKSAIELAPNNPGFFSRLFVVPKASGGWRPVIDLSTLNKYVICNPFKTETPRSVLAATRPGQWMTSVDLTDAYFHIPIHKDSRHLLRFSHMGQIWQFNAIPFGLSTSPSVFTRVMRPITAFAHRHAVRLHCYLDDLFSNPDSETEAKVQIHWLVRLATLLGLKINLIKSNIIPTQQMIYLGILINTKLGFARPSDDQIMKFVNLVQIFKSQEQPPAFQWQQVLGHITSLEKLVPGGRIRTRTLQWQLKSHWTQNQSHPSCPIPLDLQCRLHLDWWTNWTNLTKGIPLEQTETKFFLFCDASMTGYGVHLDQQTLSGQWSEVQRTLHINVLELQTVWIGLRHFQRKLQNSTVVVMTDNTSTVAYFNNPRRHKITSDMSTSRENSNLGRTTTHLDIVSTNTTTSECSSGQSKPSRSSDSFRMVPSFTSVPSNLSNLDNAQMDLFMLANNAKLPIFISPIPQPSAWKVDALSHSWEGLTA